MKDETGEATTLNNVGLINDSLGEKQALDYYNRAIPILQKTGDRRVEGYRSIILAWYTTRWVRNRKPWTITGGASDAARRR